LKPAVRGSPRSVLIRTLSVERLTASKAGGPGHQDSRPACNGSAGAGNYTLVMAENAVSSYVEALLQDRRWACALARSLVHDEHLADDVVQAAYLASLSHAPPRQVSPRAWFAGVVRNVAKMALRSRARRRTRESAAVKADDGPSAEALVARAEQH